MVNSDVLLNAIRKYVFMVADRSILAIGYIQYCGGTVCEGVLAVLLTARELPSTLARDATRSKPGALP